MLVARRRSSYIIALSLLVGAGMFNMWSRADERGSQVVFAPSPLPAKMAGWTSARENKADRVVHDMLQDDAMQWRGYKRGQQWADVLVLYGHRKRTFHLPDSCLAGAGIAIKSRQVIVLTMPDGTVVPFHALTLCKDDITRVALYTFVGPSGNPTDLLGLNAGMLMCRIRGQGPKGAAVRVIGPLDNSKPLASQPVCDLALCALREVCKRVERAAPARNQKRADVESAQCFANSHSASPECGAQWSVSKDGRSSTALRYDLRSSGLLSASGTHSRATEQIPDVGGSICPIC